MPATPLQAISGKSFGCAKRALERLGVKVLLNHLVEARGEEGALIGGALVPAASMIWAAGVAVPHLKDWLAAETDRTGRVAVTPDLSLPGHRISL